MLGCLSTLNWIEALTLSLLLKLPPRKLESWFILLSFFFLRLLCISVILFSCHVWAGALSCYLEMLDKLQKWICRTVVPSLAFSLVHLFICSSELAQLVPLPHYWGRSTCYSDRLHGFSVTIPKCYKDDYVRYVIFPVFTRVLVFLKKSFQNFLCWNLCRNDVKVRGLR